MVLITLPALELQGAYKNDLIGLEFEPMMPGQPKLTGEYIITKMMGLSLNHSKWLDLSMIFVLLFAYRLIFFLVLKAKEAAAPYIRVAYTRFTIKRLERRASFRKTLAMSSMSKRHNQPPHTPWPSRRGSTLQCHTEELLLQVTTTTTDDDEDEDDD
jgi:hypothetical protein